MDISGNALKLLWQEHYNADVVLNFFQAIYRPLKHHALSLLRVEQFYFNTYDYGIPRLSEASCAQKTALKNILHHQYQLIKLPDTSRHTSFESLRWHDDQVTVDTMPPNTSQIITYLQKVHTVLQHTTKKAYERLQKLAQQYRVKKDEEYLEDDHDINWLTFTKLHDTCLAQGNDHVIEMFITGARIINFMSNMQVNALRMIQCLQHYATSDASKISELKKSVQTWTSELQAKKQKTQENAVKYFMLCRACQWKKNDIKIQLTELKFAITQDTF